MRDSSSGLTSSLACDVPWSVESVVVSDVLSGVIAVWVDPSIRGEMRDRRRWCCRSAADGR
jgi:hypothetical protein